MDTPVVSGYWVGGCNSYLDPNVLKGDEYQWGVNISNRGGIISTRPGFIQDSLPLFAIPREVSTSVTAVVQTGRATRYVVTSNRGFRTGQLVTASVGNNNDSGTFPITALPDSTHITCDNPNGVTLGGVAGGSTITTVIDKIGCPQGITLFKPKGKKVHKVVAAGGRVYVSEFPFTSYSLLTYDVKYPLISSSGLGGYTTFALDATAREMQQIALAGQVTVKGSYRGAADGVYSAAVGITGRTVQFLYGNTNEFGVPNETGVMIVSLPVNFSTQDDEPPPVFFESTIKNVNESGDGTLTVIDPYPLLMMGTGYHRQVSWDGTTAQVLRPDQAFQGKMMKWLGSRLWTASGPRLHAGNLLDPLSTTEENLIADGGYFTFPDEITGLGATTDQKSLLVFTDYSTYTLQAGIVDRTQWKTTVDFQKILLPDIGCAAPKSVVNQFGLTWWYSHGGLIGIDNALQTYHTSKIHYKDGQMLRSKAELSPDISKICCGTFNNTLLVSAPSGDRHNSNTWVLDQSVVENNETLSPGAWSGIWTGVRPVEWASGVIEGELKTFCLSRDYISSSLGDATSGYLKTPWDYKTSVWEAFYPDKMDVDYSGTARRIESAFETKLLGLGTGGGLAQFSYAELDLAEISGVVNLEVWYCGRRGGYTRILDKQITSAPGSLGFPQSSTTVTTTDIVQPFRTQSRMVKTVTVKGGRSGTSDSGQAESIYNQNIDRSFSLLVKWTGRMSILGIRMFIHPAPELPQGKCEADESDNTGVTFTGVRVDGGDTHPQQGTINLQRSQNRLILTPRFVADYYSSNG